MEFTSGGISLVEKTLAHNSLTYWILCSSISDKRWGEAIWPRCLGRLEGVKSIGDLIEAKRFLEPKLGIIR